MTDYDPIAGIILAGGRSRRLGHDKRRLRLWGSDGPTLLEHTVQILQPLCSELLVVLNDAEHWPELDCSTVCDHYPDGAALGGLYSGLAAIQLPAALVVAADMPLLDATLLRAMAAYPRDYDALVLRSPRPKQVRNALGIEPLHAVYCRSCLETIQLVLDAGERSFSTVLERVRTTIIDPTTLLASAVVDRALFNINSIADLVQAQHIMNS